MFQERNRLLVKHEQLRAKKRERKKKHRRSKERGKGEQPGTSRAQSEEKERGHHDGRRRHKDREKGAHTIRKDSASPRTRIHKVKDDISCLKLNLSIFQHASNFLGSMVEEHQRSSYLRRVAPGKNGI